MYNIVIFTNVQYIKIYNYGALTAILGGKDVT